MGILDKVKINFPESFFSEEVRCDYTVSHKLKKIWAVEIDLLNELYRVCNKYDLKLILYCGSMLGAVRHKGFIPWDDDLDVAMLRDDYEKLLKVAKHEFQHPYFFQTALTDKECFVGYARLRNSLTTAIIDGNETPLYNNGIYIDVYVLDAFIEDESKLRNQKKKQRILETYINKTHYYIPSKNPIKRVINGILHYTLCKIIPYNSVIKLHTSIMKMYNGQTDRLSLITHNDFFMNKYRCRKSDFNELIEIQFENIQAFVPANYDRILRDMYGDYMQFPPIEKRGLWHEGSLNFDPDTPYKEYFKNKYKK